VVSPTRIAAGDRVLAEGQLWRVIRVDDDIRWPSVICVSLSGKAVLSLSTTQLAWSEQQQAWVAE
jgi:hypothetical protein